MCFDDICCQQSHEIKSCLLKKPIINHFKQQLQNRVNATKVAALNSQPSLDQAVAAASGAVGSVQSSNNATKNLARSYWFLYRTLAYNPTNKTQLSALAQYTYGRLQFESLLKQGEMISR